MRPVLQAEHLDHLGHPGAFASASAYSDHLLPFVSCELQYGVPHVFGDEEPEAVADGAAAPPPDEETQAHRILRAKTGAFGRLCEHPVEDVHVV
ncbi:MAG: hypothetical protein ACRD6W_04650, partial [Nitrososphaerales archaeon]